MTFYAKFSLLLRRVAATFLIAFMVDTGIGLVSPIASVWLFFPLWGSLIIGWPYLTRKFGFNLPKAPVPRPPSPNAKRPLAVRFLLGVGKLGLALFLLLVVSGGGVSFYRAQSCRRNLHVGMTEAEVLQTVKGWDGLRVVAHRSDADPDAEEIRAVSFITSGKRSYSVSNYGTGVGRALSESETLALLDQKLRGCDRWSFYYNYDAINQTVFFSVAFGPDGRVTEVRDIGNSD